jgi:hypothetical protein
MIKLILIVKYCLKIIFFKPHVLFWHNSLYAYNEETQILDVVAFLFRIMSETALHGFLRAIKEDVGLQA